MMITYLIVIVRKTFADYLKVTNIYFKGIILSLKFMVGTKVPKFYQYAQYSLSILYNFHKQIGNSAVC